MEVNDKEYQEDDVTLKEIIANHKELPVKVFEQLSKSLDEIEKYNKEHKE